MAPRVDPQQQRLQFSQSLKASSNSELTKRLKSLHDELRDFDQDLIDPTSLDKVARELIHPSLLLHKDKAIKAYVGTCLVDILRLYAPEAPYTQAELRDLFEFLVGQLKYVGSTDSAFQTEYFYILDSLASVKSIVLVCDLDQGSDELVERIFKVSFDTISTKSPKNVEIALSDVLLALIEELQVLPSSVTDILLSQFLPQSIKTRPASFRLAVEVCKGGSDKLQRYVAQYFAEVISESVDGGGSKGKDSDDEDDDEEDSDSDTPSRRRKSKKGGKGKGKASTLNDSTEDLPSNIRSAHELVQSLNRHVPALLLNVVPLLSSELTSTTSPAYRLLATTSLGSMFSEKQGPGDLAQSFPQTWSEWCKRSGDIAPKVRLAVAANLRGIWIRHAELGTDIESILRRLLSDHDEKVRIGACQVFEEMDYETARHHVSKEILHVVGERTVDRKEKVRQIAVRVLGRLFDLAYPEIESRDESTVDHFGWIPGKLADALKFVEPGGTSSFQLHLIDQAFAEFILPLPTNEPTITDDIPSWVDRYLVVERLLPEPPATERQALQNLTRLHEARGGTFWYAFLEACEAYNSGIIGNKDNVAGIKEYLNKTIKAIASKMPDPTKAAEDLKTFAKHNEKIIYQKLRTLLDPQTELKTFVKTEKEVMKRVKKMGDSVATTFASFIRLSCYTLINRSSIPHLLKRFLSTSTAPEDDAYSASAHRTLRFIAKTRPILFKSHFAELVKVLSTSEKEEGSDKAERAIELALYALAKLKEVDLELVIDVKLSKRALQYAKESKTNSAKYAATIVALDSSRTGTLDDLVEYLADKLAEDSPDDLVPHLASLARIAKYGQDSFEQKSEQVTRECLEVLQRSSRDAEAPNDPSRDWLDDGELHSLTSARLFAIKVLTNRCIPFANTASASAVSAPVFSFLWTMLDIGLNVVEEDEEEKYHPAVASRLRLQSSLSILKLVATRDPNFLKPVSQNFNLLARTAQDTCFEVRDGYLRKVLQRLRSGKIHPVLLPSLNMSLFLVAHEPDQDLRTPILHFIRVRSRRPDRQATWELPFLRLFSILAHHPDFEGELELNEYQLMAKYIELYLECLATSENISLLYHLAQLIKTTRDSTSATYDNLLYTLSELAQHLIKSFAEQHHWPLTTLPKNNLNIKVPGDVFRSIGNADKMKEIAKKTFLPEAVLDQVSVKEKKVAATKKRKSQVKDTTTTNGQPKKRGRPAKTTKSKSVKKRKSGQEWVSSESEPEDDESEEEEDDEEIDEDGDVVEKKVKKKISVKASKGSAGSARKGLRSTPNKKGTAELIDDVEMEDQEEEEEEKGTSESDSVATTKKKSATNGKAKATPTKKKPAATATSASKTKKKVSPAKKSTRSKPEEKKKRAVPTRGAASRRKLDAEEVSDLAESDGEDEDMSD